MAKDNVPIVPNATVLAVSSRQYARNKGNSNNELKYDIRLDISPKPCDNECLASSFFNVAVLSDDNLTFLLSLQTLPSSLYMNEQLQKSAHFAHYVSVRDIVSETLGYAFGSACESNW